MHKIYGKLAILFLGAVFSLLACSCALGNRLNMKSAEETEVTGNFRLILYGCTHYDDLETVAILDREDDQYVFEPFAPAFNYQVMKEMPARDAIAKAQTFVDCHNAFRRAQLSRLVDAAGETLGFEVRPLYMPFVFGTNDVLYTDYRIKDGKVIVKIRLLRSIEDMLNSGGGGRDRD